jgi:hypothetical protein
MVGVVRLADEAKRDGWAKKSGDGNGGNRGKCTVGSVDAVASMRADAGVVSTAALSMKEVLKSVLASVLTAVTEGRSGVMRAPDRPIAAVVE